ncbi:unnamed protein product [Diabrotica balteata]|uniref:NADP-dependent oxidoreductase domain-containing protein n=1 Tax=Diabrotica balteata TaxID=107213 RepID=A0A9N9T199_DIABA|nr:unnamed protein product [Diabrotica balteata]
MATKAFKKMIGGQKMPAIGLGTWMSTDEQELEDAMNAALDAGYRHFDTATVYGNEALIGKILNKWFSSGKIKREELFITTKLPICGGHADRVEMFIKQSLKDLKLEYLDLYLIHFPVVSNYVGVPVTPPDQFKLEPADHISLWQKMEEQVDAGRTKSIGISNFTQKQIERILKSCRIQPACLQVELHVYLQQKDLVNFAHKKDIVVVGYSPLGNPGYNKFLATLGVDGKELPNLLQHPIVKGLAEKYNKTAGQILIRFLIEKGIVPIPKSVNPKRVIENINVFDFNLENDDIKQLENLDVGEKARVCDFGFFPVLKECPEFPFGKL